MKEKSKQLSAIWQWCKFCKKKSARIKNPRCLLRFFLNFDKMFKSKIVYLVDKTRIMSLYVA